VFVPLSLSDLINFGDLYVKSGSATNTLQPPPDSIFYDEFLDKLLGNTAPVEGHSNLTQVSIVKNGQASKVSSKLSVATVATGRPQLSASQPQTPTLKRTAREISSPEDESSLDESGSGTSPISVALTAEQKKAKNKAKNQARDAKRKEAKALEKAASPNNNNSGPHNNNIITKKSKI
jgi:hypothetical protein